MKFKLLENEERELFLPELVKNNTAAMINYENLIYNLMEQSTDEYKGGMWQFILFTNGAKAMVMGLPDFEGDNPNLADIKNMPKVDIKMQQNYFSSSMSMLALSLSVNFVACSHMSFAYEGTKCGTNLGRNYELLREAILKFDEASYIFGYLD